MMTTTALLLLAQTPCEVLLADSRGDQLVRLADLNGDGSIRDLNEASALWRESGNRTPRALTVSQEGGRTQVTWIDSALDKIHRGEDLNANGVIEAFERVVVRSSGSLDGATTGQGIAVTSDGAIWWSSDAGKSGLFRLRDLDGDGLASKASESEFLVGGAGNSHPLETSAGVLTMNTRYLTEVEALDDRVVVYGDGPDEFLSVFAALNDDGDLLDSGESRLFLNASGKRGNVPQNVDWANGKLRNLTIPASGGGSFYGRLSSIAVDVDGPVPVWYFACNSAFGSVFDTNLNGQGLNGLIFRGLDLNGDGDLQDAGEVRRFYDGSHTSALLGFEEILALDTCGGALYVAFLEVGERRVGRLFDADGNGNAEGVGEYEGTWFESSNWPGKPPFENGPQLIQDLAALPAGDLLPPNTLYQSLGPGCDYTSYGSTPTLHGVGRAHIGSVDFSVELRGAPDGSFSWLMAGDDYPAWFTYWLPANLGFLGTPNCSLYLKPAWQKRALTTGQAGDSGGGMAFHTFFIPPNPLLIGTKIRVQWVVYDWFGGLAYSGGGEVEIEP